MSPITEIAAKAGIEEKYLEQYGNYKAKIDYTLLRDKKEDPDGKLILGNTQVLDQITYERLEQFIPKDQWIQAYTESSLISWQNWTMMIHMTEILKNVLSNIWPYVENKTDRICFFDLADPAKRSACGPMLPANLKRVWIPITPRQPLTGHVSW